jgi:hypothetical protein
MYCRRDYRAMNVKNKFECAVRYRRLFRGCFYDISLQSLSNAMTFRGYDAKFYYVLRWSRTVVIAAVKVGCSTY